MTAPGGAPLRLGTRRSALALTQSGWVADQLRAIGYAVDLVEIVTEGDVNAAPLTQIGGTGVFASALRHALHEGRVDFAVHSLKDLPVAPEPGLTLAAIPPREDPRDALVARDGLTLRALPPGSVIGTGSPRRAAQLRLARPDVEIRPIRGNVGTRLRKVSEGECDAVVLARAGLARLGLVDEVTELLEPEVMLPAAGQGALALECRLDSTYVTEALAHLEHPGTRACVVAEREFLAVLEAGCTAPVGALASVDASGEGLTLAGFVLGAGDRGGVRRTLNGGLHDPLGIGQRLATELLADR